MIASAASSAVRSAKPDSAYPPPSCSRFHGRIGSRLCTVATCGIEWTSFARWPPRFAYQVWLWTSSAPATPAAIVRSIENACSAAAYGSDPASSDQGRCATTAGPPRDGRAVGTPAVHRHVGHARELAGEVLDVDAGPAVDVRWILAREQRDPRV